MNSCPYAYAKYNYTSSVLCIRRVGVNAHWFGAANLCESNGGAKLCTREQLARACTSGFNVVSGAWLADTVLHNQALLTPNGCVGQDGWQWRNNAVTYAMCCREHMKY